MNTKVNSSKVNQCILVYKGASQVALVVKSLPACAGDIRDVGSIPGSGRFPKRRSWQPIPVFLVGESCGQSSLTGFPGSSAGKESTCNEGDPSSIPGLGSSPGEGISYPLQYSQASLVAQMVKNLPAM